MSQHAPFKLFRMDISYFSGKLEAYLNYKQIPFERVEAHHSVLFDVYRKTGTMKVPAVETSDGLWLKDSTPMIRWFETQYPQNPVLPDDPALAFIAALIEDYADEWLWRPAMWWRWVPKGSRRLMGYRIATEVLISLPIPTFMAGPYFAWRQKKMWLDSDGMTKANEHQIRDMYTDQLAALEPIFKHQPYLLGSHPSVADYGYFASMFRHFGNDPESSVVMRKQAPAVYEWLARMWNRNTDDLGAAIDWQTPEGEGWDFILGDICKTYLPYLQQNAEAFKAGQQRFNFSANGLALPKTVTTDYRVWCRQVLQRDYAALADEHKAVVQEMLAPHGGVDALFAGGEIDAGMDEDLAIPFPARPEISMGKRLYVWLMGTARNVPK